MELFLSFTLNQKNKKTWFFKNFNYNNIIKRIFKGEKKNNMKTYLINEELLKKVISTLVDYFGVTDET